jgi:D-serine deaminase-like pyridoxal phosphate-dependent protein
MPSDFSQLETPCLILEDAKLQRNINRMLNKASTTGVKLRPHAKTAKSAQIMERFGDGENRTGLTVSTLREAEYFAQNGFKDVLYAVCITPDKFPRVGALLKQDICLTVVLDSLEVCQRLSEFAGLHRVIFSVGIEIDCDGHRAGLLHDDAEVPEIAKLISESQYLEFWGVMTHGGGSYSASSLEELKNHAELERTAIAQAANEFLSQGISCKNVSLGSTPTVFAAEHFDGVTEIRPGVFVFYDLFQAQLGTCEQDDIALSVLATVTSHKPASKRIFVDAGGLALSKDRSTQHQKLDYGYGKVIKENGDEFAQLVTVSGVNQEHGVIDLPEGLSVADFPIGLRVRILPNHSCMTAAAYNGYNLLQESGELRWVTRCNGW